MDPDVAAAIPELERSGALQPAVAARLLRIAKGELVSVHAELRLLLYGGVLLVAAGAGLLVSEKLDRIGPTAVALAIGLAAAACLVWVARTAPPFSRDEVASPHFAFDYILLLGALLVAAELAYVEVSFTPLGADWTWHLLIVSILYAALAFRYDSRTLFSLSLTTFAAWRGVSLAVLAERFGHTFGSDRAVVEGVACGLAFVLVGEALERADFKHHFEPVAVHIGWLLVLLSQTVRLGSGAGRVLLLLASGAVVAAIGYRGRRFWLLAMGVVAAHVALTYWIARNVLSSHIEPVLLWLVVSGLAIVVGLGAMHRRLREER
jgi:hypothetical protein